MNRKTIATIILLLSLISIFSHIEGLHEHVGEPLHHLCHMCGQLLMAVVLVTFVLLAAFPLVSTTPVSPLPLLSGYGMAPDYPAPFLERLTRVKYFCRPPPLEARTG